MNALCDDSEMKIAGDEIMMTPMILPHANNASVVNICSRKAMAASTIVKVGVTKKTASA